MRRSIAERLTTQASVWEVAKEFASRGGFEKYASKRNYVSEDLSEVSVLSPAVRHRLITEYQLADFAEDIVGKKQAQKYVQEVYWRIYWKGWLEQRPTIWFDWLDSIDKFSQSQREQEDSVANGETGIEVMDYFAKQLIETGYLHNHARMWFAAFWVHHLKLPWELGAKFFMSHLLDGDPASNTLSWRWVAGLHTRGKAYQASAQNIQKYLHPAILDSHQSGLEKIQYSDLDAEELFMPLPERILLPELPSHCPKTGGNIGIFLHEDDLDFASSPLSSLSPKAVFVGADASAWSVLEPSKLKQDYLDAVLEDCHSRAESHFKSPVQLNLLEGQLDSNFSDWVEKYRIETVVYMQPFIGPAYTACEALKTKHSDLDWRPLRRLADSTYFPLAKSGFFGFWKKVEKQIERR